MSVFKAAAVQMRSGISVERNLAEAIKWYTISKRLAANPDYSKEVDERIKALR